MLVNKHPEQSYLATIDLQGFAAGSPAHLWRHDQATPGLQSAYTGPLTPLELRLPPYSTSMLVVPPRTLPPALRNIGLGGTAAALLAAGAAELLRRRRRRK
jgi:hypothetical protein